MAYAQFIIQHRKGIKERKLFFRLSRFQKQLEEIYQNDLIQIMPPNRKQEVVSFIESGLKDFSISRSQERAHNWGISVPMIIRK